ncbi:MAG: hypothetical protein U0893_14590 [Chloroflexota bacterium]
MLKRRGLLAGVTALIGAGLAHLARPSTAEATHGGASNDLVRGSIANTADQDTALRAISFNPAGSTGTELALAMFASQTHPPTLFDPSFGRFGVLGKIGPTNYALSASNPQAGVWGINANGDGAHGVLGETTGFGAGVRAVGSGVGIGLWADAASRVGIFGTSTGNTGVFGVSKASNPNATVAPGSLAGVAGQGFDRIGVLGISDTNIGVQGSSTNGVGVQGFSTAQIGVRGDSVNNYAVYGRSSLTALRGEATGGGVGFVGLAVNPEQGGLAGAFFGGVTIQGSFTQSGGPKSAAVPHPDGSYRRMYCQESTEAWFEDFGTATLTNGRAEVTLDPDFDAVVKGDDYMVFLTPEGDSKGLFISRKGPHKFVVEEQQAGKSTLPFSYRVVSRRREAVGARLEKVDMKGPPMPKNPPQKVGPDGRLVEAEPTSPRIRSTHGT